MRVTRWTTIALGVAVGAAVTWLALAVLAAAGAAAPAVSWSVGAVLAVGAVALVVLGWPVRQYTRGKRPHIDPLRAARILTLAKACAIVGSLLVGGYLVVFVEALGHLTSALLQQRAWAAGGAVVGSGLLATAALLVEFFCRIPPEDGEEADSASPGHDPHPA